MIQLKPYQIRNTVYVLAFDLFRNQVERELMVKGKRTGKKLSQRVVFQSQPLPCPYGQCRQGGAGELLGAHWHSWAFHVGKYCWVSEGLATELPVKKWWHDACWARSSTPVETEQSFSTLRVKNLWLAWTNSNRSTLIIVFSFSRHSLKNLFSSFLIQVLSDVISIPHLEIQDISTFVPGEPLLSGPHFLCAKLSSSLLIK